ncbi:MAG TPA: LPXTG cell wall anchor domain-containing protein, partial [Acidimicrobiia bacterium]
AVDSNALGVTGTGQTPQFELTVAEFIQGIDDVTIDAGLVQPEIPETGFDTDRLGLMAAGLVTGGLMLILLGRRRREEQ